jgi:hypothetical protein
MLPREHGALARPRQRPTMARAARTANRAEGPWNPVSVRRARGRPDFADPGGRGRPGTVSSSPFVVIARPGDHDAGTGAVNSTRMFSPSAEITGPTMGPKTPHHDTQAGGRALGAPAGARRCGPGRPSSAAPSTLPPDRTRGGRLVGNRADPGCLVGLECRIARPGKSPPRTRGTWVQR